MKIFPLQVILVILILFTIEKNTYAKIDIIYAKNVRITITNFKQRLLNKLHNKKNINIELFLYHYSSGKEIYTLKKDQTIVIKSGPKEIKATIKIFKNKKIFKVHFINEEAATEENLIKILSEKTNKFIENL